MNVLKTALVVLTGVVAVIATEGGVVAWMTYAPSTLDLTGYFFTLTLLPVVTLVVVLAGLLLWKIAAANPWRNWLLFSATYLGVELLGLVQLGNPVGDVVTYGVIIAGVCAVAFFVFTRWFWPRIQPGATSP